MLFPFNVSGPSLCRYFWYNDALGASDSIGRAASFNWKIFLCLLLAWVVVYLCLFRGIKSSGKVCVANTVLLDPPCHKLCCVHVTLHGLANVGCFFRRLSTSQLPFLMWF